MKNFGLTEKELKYIPLKKEVRAEEEKKFDRLDWFLSILFGAVIAGAIVGLLLSIWILTDRAEAKELETNASYCAGIEQGLYKVSDEDKDAVTSYCNSL